jgi:peptidoglycan/xylan/chitin deacetylase (PgdA/CDA1 family)
MRSAGAVAAALLAVAAGASPAVTASAPDLTLVAQHPGPVLTTRSPGAAGNRFGFEGGRVVKVAGTYHLFTSEMVDNPMWVRMTFGHWSSPDRLHWTRVGTVRRSSAEFAGKDPKAALWSPLPVWDPDAGRWNLFYVAYRSKPGDGTAFTLNFDGRIWRAVSRTPGEGGIGGPYEDVGVVLQPGSDSLPWEGLQGTDSFFPWKHDGRWLALYGSAKTDRLPIEHWLVGLAESATLAGPWSRVPDHSPVPIERRFIENPIVTPAPGGGYFAVYDAEAPDAIGWAWSADGVTWQPGHALVVQPTPGNWAKDVRTPLGLVDEGGGRYTVFYTGFEQDPDWDRLLRGQGKETCAVGFAEVSVARPAASNAATLAWPNGARAALSLSFDDARPSQLTNGMPLLARHHTRATFYLTGENVTAHAAEWRDAAKAGHELGNHTMTHPCSGNFAWSRDRALEDATLDRMRQEMNDASRAIADATGVHPTTFAYPCGQKFVGRGSRVQSYVPVVSDMFLAGRGWLDEGPNDPTALDLAQLYGFPMDDVEFDALAPAIDDAIARGQWLVLAGHDIGPGPGHQVTRTSMLDALLDYVNDPSRHVWVDTVANVAAAVRDARQGSSRP